MTQYLLSEERLIKFATAELRCKILDMDPEHEHFEANTEYWSSILKAGPERILQSYYHHEDVAPQADPKSELCKRVYPDFHKRVTRLEGNFQPGSYPVILDAFNMDSQDCYSLFGMSNDNLGGLENLNSMLINGLYDDSDLGIVKSDHDFWNISWVGDEFERRLDIDDVRAIIKKKAEQSTFYAAHGKEIEASGFLDKDGMSRKYFKIGQEFDKFFRTFMRQEDQDAIAAEEQRRKDELNERLAEYRKEKADG